MSETFWRRVLSSCGVWSVRRRPSGRCCGWWRAGAWKGLAFGGLFALLAGGCPPTENVVTDPSGQSIRLTSIDRIVTNPDLSEEQKRQGLRDLGITDEELIDFLLQEGDDTP